MPLTESGKKVLEDMVSRYGEKKGEEVFYASIKDKKPGSDKWHEPEKGPERRERSRGKRVHYS